MRKKHKSGKNSIPLIITAVVLLIACVGVSMYSGDINRQKKQSLEEKSALAMEYIKETERITQEIESLKVQIKKMNRIGSQMSVAVFAQCTDNLYKDIFPISKSNKAAGCFVMTGEERVGEKGCITLAQYDELLSAGWTAAICAPKTKGNPEEYVSSIAAHLKKLDRDMPTTYYFPEGTFNKENLEFAKSKGFNTFFYMIDEPYAKEVNKDMATSEDAVYIPYVFMSVTQKVYERFDSIVSAGGCCSIATRYAVSTGGFSQNEDMDPEYDSFINSVKDMYDAVAAEYGCERTVAEYRAEVYAAKVELVKEKAMLQEQITALTLRREELNTLIVEIYGSDLNA